MTFELNKNQYSFEQKGPAREIKKILKKNSFLSSLNRTEASVKDVLESF